jgi:hypothetical protein
MFLVRGYAAQELWEEALGELKVLSSRGYRELDVLESDEMLDGLRKQKGWAEIKALMSGGKVPAATPGSRPKGPGPRPGTPRAPPGRRRGDGHERRAEGPRLPPDAPPASVMVDNRPRGQAPLSLELNAGTHTVVIEKRGFKKFKKDVKVRCRHLHAGGEAAAGVGSGRADRGSLGVPDERGPASAGSQPAKGARARPRHRGSPPRPARAPRHPQVGLGAFPAYSSSTIPRRSCTLASQGCPSIHQARGEGPPR